MAKPITGKQCQKARGLLKWNHRDLGTRCALDAKRIDSFEKGVIRLQKGEMDAVMAAFDKEEVQFQGNFEVALKSGNTASSNSGGGGSQKQEVYDATEDYMSEIERQQANKKAAE